MPNAATDHEREIIKLREHIETLEAGLVRERERRRVAELRAGDLLDGVLDRQELAEGFNGGALLEAVRRVRAILSPVVDGADGLTTVGLAKAAAAHAQLGRGPAPAINAVARLSVSMAMGSLHELARDASADMRAGLAHAAAVFARQRAQR